MQKFVKLLIVLISISSCEKRLDEKIIEGRDIRVNWYKVSAITSAHEFVEVSKKSTKEQIMEANTGTIDSIYIGKDTIFIKQKSANVIYTLKKNRI